MEGQMFPQERIFLHQAVLECAPKLALEVGTWKGGGSTYQIASAIHGKGRLYTCETDENFYKEAVAGYAGNPLHNSISFFLMPSTSLIQKMIADSTIPEFVFFDGPEDPDLALSDFQLIDKYLPIGAYFCMHDWDLGPRCDGATSNKATQIRPYLENCQHWQILRTLTTPVSVGIVLAKKIRPIDQ